MTVTKIVTPLAGMLGLKITGDEGLLRLMGDVLLSTPVFAISAMIVGQWIGELLDGYHYRIEGGTGGASKRHLMRRLRFTKWILKRPFWYPNEDRITREFERTNRALMASGIAPIDAVEDEADNRARSTQTDYIEACLALIGGMGVRRAALLSPAIKRRSMRIGLNNGTCIPDETKSV